MGSVLIIVITTVSFTTTTTTTLTLLLLYCALLLLSCAPLALSGPLFSEFISPNFTASNFQFIDQTGAFLASPNGTFRAAIQSPRPEHRSFYFSVVHSPSGLAVWSANRDSPISDSASLRLTITGLTITDDAGEQIWSTPKLNSTVARLQLRESGNLVLLDEFNSTLWESFRFPTDTIVSGQRLFVGESLVGSVDDNDLRAGDYRFVVTNDNAILKWNGMNYWRLSMVTNAFIDSTFPVSYMEINGSGLYLYSGSNSVLVMRMSLGKSDFRIAKLGSNGRFVVSSFVGNSWVQDFRGPLDDCRIPFVCGEIGLCSTGVCSCPASFHSDPQSKNCGPADKSYSLPEACGNGSESNMSISYIKLSNGIDYFANDFIEPVRHGVNLSVCETLCSQNCSCLGMFHDTFSGSCYILQNHLGSLMSSSRAGTDRLGYIKALYVSSSADNPSSSTDKNRNFPIVALILLPSSGGLLILALVVLVIFLLRRKRKTTHGGVKLGRRNSSSSGELEITYIPGLPLRFEYEDLVAATQNFSIQIGSGGFGIVYKGTLQDKTVVAVKKMTSLGGQGKKDFCTEIAIIGNIHHINLVRLKGYCTQHRQRFLVYEFMNRGSLDKALFGNGPVLEWQERYDIALGTARGLAYLHTGCEQKIIHCDVKPENILLHDNVQVKLSDFGLSKLLSPEQSGLFTTLRGTRGYLAPEWLTSSAISDKTDVYSYGMVLLEIIRGRKNCSLHEVSYSIENDGSSGNSRSNSSFGGVQRVYFPLFALEMYEERRYLELADPRLERRVTSEEVEKLVRVALCCVHEEPSLRPSMANVVGMLEGGQALGEPRLGSLNFLRFYGRRFTEDSAIEGYNEMNQFVLNPEGNGTPNSTTSGSHNSFSYMSSQQVSGPR